MEKVITTAASNEFFPWLLNLIGSIQTNYPDYPQIIVYDLGLAKTFKHELNSIKKVEVRSIPHFAPFWRDCYTWKLWIFQNPLAKLNLHIDAGAVVLRPLDEIFQLIERDGYCAIDQGPLAKLIPEDYYELLNVPREIAKKEAFTAGIFGFNATPGNRRIIGQAYQWGIKGYGLGYSLGDKRRHKISQRRFSIRDCEYFRHDQTLLNMAFQTNISNLKIQPVDKYAGWQSEHDHPQQLIYNCRKNNDAWNYWDKVIYEKKYNWFVINHFIFLVYRFLKKIKHALIRNP